MMKVVLLRQLLAALLCSWLILPLGAQAASLDAVATAHNQYLFSAVCRAAYTDHRGDRLVEVLREAGWRVETYFQEGDKAAAKFLVAVRPEDDGQPGQYLIAIAGTESKKDLAIDLTYDKTPFCGPFLTVPDASVALGRPEGETRMVHKGFLHYVKTALTVQPPGQPGLVEELLAHPERKVYLVGHSLGGAVATLGGAVLLESGVLPEQVEVVTFGAPPVGNQAFADSFAGRLKLTRIVAEGDPVAGFLLVDLVGGYRQFGAEVKWAVPNAINKSPHVMALYSDLAMKRYYDELGRAQQAGVLTLKNEQRTAGQPVVYVAPLTTRLPEELRRELPYIKAHAGEVYRNVLPGYVVEPGAKPFVSAQQALARAAAVGAEAAVVTEVQAERIRTEKRLYYVTVSQSVYRVKDRALISYLSMGSNTRELTPLDAFARGLVDAALLSDPWRQLLAGDGTSGASGMLASE